MKSRKIDNSKERKVLQDLKKMEANSHTFGRSSEFASNIYYLHLTPASDETVSRSPGNGSTFSIRFDGHCPRISGIWDFICSDIIWERLGISHIFGLVSGSGGKPKAAHCFSCRWRLCEQPRQKKKLLKLGRNLTCWSDIFGCHSNFSLLFVGRPSRLLFY